MINRNYDDVQAIADDHLLTWAMLQHIWPPSTTSTYHYHSVFDPISIKYIVPQYWSRSMFVCTLHCVYSPVVRMQTSPATANIQIQFESRIIPRRLAYCLLSGTYFFRYSAKNFHKNPKLRVLRHIRHLLTLKCVDNVFDGRRYFGDHVNDESTQLKRFEFNFVLIWCTGYDSKLLTAIHRRFRTIFGPFANKIIASNSFCFSSSRFSVGTSCQCFINFVCNVVAPKNWISDDCKWKAELTNEKLHSGGQLHILSRILFPIASVPTRIAKPSDWVGLSLAIRGQSIVMLDLVAVVNRIDRIRSPPLPMFSHRPVP